MERPGAEACSAERCNRKWVAFVLNLNVGPAQCRATPEVRCLSARHACCCGSNRSVVAGDRSVRRHRDAAFAARDVSAGPDTSIHRGGGQARKRYYDLPPIRSAATDTKPSYRTVGVRAWIARILALFRGPRGIPTAEVVNPLTTRMRLGRIAPRIATPPSQTVPKTHRPY